MAEGYKGDVVLIAATAGALATLGVVAAHQFGALEHLPDPPGALFDSDGITESKAAHPFGVPDSALGLASFGTTMALAILARRSSGARRLLALKLVLDGSAAGFNVVRQVAQFGKICSWCTGTALCTAGMVVAGRGLIASEVGADAHELRRLTGDVD